MESLLAGCRRDELLRCQAVFCFNDDNNDEDDEDDGDDDVDWRNTSSG